MENVIYKTCLQFLTSLCKILKPIYINKLISSKLKDNIKSSVKHIEKICLILEANTQYAVG